MYNNVGKKIMVLAQIFGWVCFAAGFITCVAMVASDNMFGWIALGGGVVLLFSTWLLYGFGQLVQDVHEMKEKATAPIDEPIPEPAAEEESDSDTKEEQKAQDFEDDIELKKACEPETPEESIPVVYEPIREKPEKKVYRTLPEMLAYAAKFTTDSGMTEYLNRDKDTLPEEDRIKVEKLLKLTPNEIREAIKKMTEEA